MLPATKILQSLISACERSAQIVLEPVLDLLVEKINSAQTDDRRRAFMDIVYKLLEKTSGESR